MKLKLSGKQYRQLRAAICDARNLAIRQDNFRGYENLSNLLSHLRDERDRFHEEEEAEATRNSEDKARTAAAQAKAEAFLGQEKYPGCYCTACNE